jgi:hypothetical protein
LQASASSKGRGAASGKIERPGLTEEEIEEIREAFNLFDTDGSGKWAVPLISSSLSFCCAVVLVVQATVAAAGLARGVCNLAASERPACSTPRRVPAGSIDPKELKAAMQSLGFEAKNATI